MRKAMETQAIGECFHGCFEFYQTFTSVTITLWKQGKNVFDFFYEMNAQKNLLSFQRVMVNGFQPVSVHGILFILYNCKIKL